MRIIRINNVRLEEDIELFKKKKVKNINILDPTFLLTNEDNDTLEKLLSINSCKNICLQMHFESIKEEKGERFIEICSKNINRVSLEFGLQTIHPDEMKVLHRNNDIQHIKDVMRRLKENKINLFG
jgi:radical SAM superfamily enzyme